VRRKLLYPLEPNDLKAMHTGSLLARLEQFRRCEESIETSDMATDEVPEGRIIFKQSSEWLRANHDVKAELATREHIDGGEERAAKRNLQTRRSNHGRRNR
jgi:hypothetical protein